MIKTRGKNETTIHKHKDQFFNNFKIFLTYSKFFLQPKLISGAITNLCARKYEYTILP